MASCRPYKDKNGKITSYQIRVSGGSDVSGKKIMYTKTWKVPKTYKSEKAIQKALDREAGKFEEACKRHEVTTDKRSFTEYAQYYIDLATRDNKQRSIDFYNTLLPRINESIGNIQLSKLTAKDLNELYLNLQKEDVRKDKKAVATDYMLKVKSQKKITHRKLALLSGLAENTVRIACQQKNIALKSAQKISDALGIPMDKAFNVVHSSSKNGLSAKTINHYHTFIHAVLRQAKREGIVTVNVAENATPPRVKKKEAEFFEVEELLQIRAALDREPIKYKIMLSILTDTGIRRGELFGLCWDAIDFKGETIDIKRNVQRSKSKGLYVDTPKGGDYRAISVDPEIIRLLKKYRAEEYEFKINIGNPDYNPQGFLFHQENGENPTDPSSLNHWMKGFEERHNLPHIYPHKFRHSQASILYAENIDVITISNRLGHKQVSTTQNIYGHLLKRSDRKASNAISNVLYRNKAE